MRDNIFKAMLVLSLALGAVSLSQSMAKADGFVYGPGFVIAPAPAYYPYYVRLPNTIPPVATVNPFPGYAAPLGYNPGPLGAVPGYPAAGYGGGYGLGYGYYGPVPQPFYYGSLDVKYRYKRGLWSVEYDVD